MTPADPTVTAEQRAGLREAAENAAKETWIGAVARFERLATPATIIALLDERDRLEKGLIALEQAVLAGNAALRASEAERDTLARACKNDHDSYKALLAEAEAERERMRVALVGDDPEMPQIGPLSWLKSLFEVARDHFDDIAGEDPDATTMMLDEVGRLYASLRATLTKEPENAGRS